ncbi:hypothetical protein ABK040_014707 [Willaertia magna]
MYKSFLSYYYKATQQVHYYLPYFTFNATPITDNIWLGDIHDAYNIPALQENKITHIITCIKDMEPFYPNDFNYLNLHLYDTIDETLTFEETFKFIDDNVNKGNRILIHCMKGRSRSASLLISYLMKKNNWSYETALQFVKEKRTIVQPNDGFVKQLLIYEQQILNK